MGQARVRKLAGDTSAKRPMAYLVRRERPEPIHCRKCAVELAGHGETGICGRCASVEERIAKTGSAHARPINRPERRERRVKARKGSPS
jgi:ribosomal protein S27AE